MPTSSPKGSAAAALARPTYPLAEGFKAVPGFLADTGRDGMDEARHPAARTAVPAP